MKCQMRGQDWLKMFSGKPFLFVQNVILLCLAGGVEGKEVCFLPLVMRIYKYPLLGVPKGSTALPAAPGSNDLKCR